MPRHCGVYFTNGFPAVGLAGVGGWEQVAEGDAEACKALRAARLGIARFPYH
jgi:hypothetical protein